MLNSIRIRHSWLAFALTLLMLFSNLVFSLPMAMADSLTVTLTSPSASVTSSVATHVYSQVSNLVDPANVHFTWEFGNGINNNIYANIGQIALINSDTNQAITLNKGQEADYVFNTDGVCAVGDFKYTNKKNPLTRQLEFILTSTTLVKDTNYSLILGSGIVANNTYTLGKDYVWNFRTSGPTLVSGATDHLGKEIILKFDRAMADPGGTQSQFAVSFGGASNAVTGVYPGASADQIVLFLSESITNTANATVSYTHGTVAAADGSQLQAFTAQVVTNNVLPASSSMTGFDGNAVEVSYDEAASVLKYRYVNPVDYDNVELCWYFTNGFHTPMVSNLNNHVSIYEKDTGAEVALPNLLTQPNTSMTYDGPLTTHQGQTINEQVATDWYFWQIGGNSPLGLDLVSRALKPSTTYIVEIGEGFAFNSGNSTATTYTFEFTTTADSQYDPYWADGSSLTVSNIGDTSLNLSWPAASDNHGVAYSNTYSSQYIPNLSYNIYRDGTLLTTVDGDTTSYNVSSLSPDTSYNFKVEAVDFAGNYSLTDLEAPAQTTGQVSGVPITDSTVAIDESGTNRIQAITASTPSFQMTVPDTVSNAAIDVSSLLTTSGDTTTTSALPAMNIAAATSISSTPVVVSVPAGITISAPASSNWDGTINVPTVMSSSSVTVPATSGYNASVGAVIEVGCGDVALNLSQAVRLLIPGQAGKEVGYSRNGTFTKITTELTADTQEAGDALAEGGEGKVDVGNDLVVWTKHFTAFVTYTETAASSGGSSSTTGGESQTTTGQNRLSFNSSQSYLVTVSGTSASPIASIQGNTSVPVNPTIMLYFDRGVTNESVWSNNQHCITLHDNGGSNVPINVFWLENQPGTTYVHDIFLTPTSNLIAGKTYTIVISKNLKANNGKTLGENNGEQDETVIFTVAGSSTVATGGGGGGVITTAGPTSTSGTASVDPAVGATVCQGSDAVVVIPANALNGRSYVSVSVKKVASPPAAPADARPASDVYEFTVSNSSTYTFGSDVSITLNYSASAIASDETAAVFCYDESQKQWFNLGGTVSGNAIMVKVNHFTKYAVFIVKKTAAQITEPGLPEATITVAPKLNDISGHWAEAAIRKLVALGAVSGYSDGSFKADNRITRAEFTTILVKAFKITSQNGKVFGDTAGHWASDSIAAAVDHGIVSGYDADRFGPNDLVTREQMAMMVVKAARFTTTSDKTTFTDSADISDWAGGAVGTAVANGIIKGYLDNSFKPQGSAARAEAITVIVNALK